MYIVEPSRQNEIIKEMKQLRRDTEKYEVYFHHTLNDQMWKSFFPRATEQGLGPKLLRQEPQPESLADRLMICLSEEVEENAIGLGIELSTRVELWPEIISQIEEDRKQLNSSQIRLFFKHLRLKRYRENLEELGIDPEEKPFSDKEFKKLLWRARKLIIKTYLF